MDGDARSALSNFVRAEVSQDLDRMHVELARDLDRMHVELEQVAAEVGGLRREVRALRSAQGLDPSSRSERRGMVLALRAEGHSERAIAAMLATDRRTVVRDLRELGVPRPSSILGLDGRLTRGPRPAA